MRKISSFTFLTLNGFYKGPNEDTSWHRHGEEEGKFSEEQLKADNILVFGRTTYEMMYSFWPTPMAHELFPKVAVRMNQSEKLVVSDTLKEATWENTGLLKGNVVEQVKSLKASPGKNLTILGSGSIVSLLTDANQIDEYKIMIDPVVVGNGTPLFQGVKGKLDLKLTDTHVFKSGVVLLTYEKRV